MKTLRYCLMLVLALPSLANAQVFTREASETAESFINREKPDSLKLAHPIIETTTFNHSSENFVSVAVVGDRGVVNRFTIFTYINQCEVKESFFTCGTNSDSLFDGPIGANAREVEGTEVIHPSSFVGLKSHGRALVVSDDCPQRSFFSLRLLSQHCA